MAEALVVAGMNKRVLVVTKKSFYQIYALEVRDPYFLKFLEQGSELAKSIVRDHEENRKAIEKVLDFLDRCGVHFTVGSARSPEVDRIYDLVLTVGGDGTLLAASHWVFQTPIAGINSRPNRSVGHFCVADVTNFEPVLTDILEERLKPRTVMRMDVYLNGKLLQPPVLNDVLYSPTNPAASVTYLVELGGIVEKHKGGGMWICTPAGSTAAMSAAGGVKMPIFDTRLQFKARELFKRRASETYRLEHGFFTSGFKIVNLTPEAGLYVDGTAIFHRLRYGDYFEPVPSQKPLKIFLKTDTEEAWQ